MGEAFCRTVNEDGLLRDYSGTIWEELIYHALYQNLPETQQKLKDSIRCIWCFHGLNYRNDWAGLGISLPQNKNEIEIDFILTGATVNNEVFLLPIEVKAVPSSDDYSEDEFSKKRNERLNKAKIQCHKNYTFLHEVLSALSLSSKTAKSVIIQPVILLCNTGFASLFQPFHETIRGTNFPILCFNLHFDKYNQHFCIGENTEENLLLKVLHNALRSVNQNKMGLTQQNYDLYCQVVGLLTSLSSCEVEPKRNHDEGTCLNHFSTADGKKVCMKGTFLCPKYIHKFVTQTVTTLSYLCSLGKHRANVHNLKRAGLETELRAFHVNTLSEHIQKYAKRYFTWITSEQKEILESGKTRVTISGPHGAGKTIIMLVKAMSIVDEIVSGRSTLKGICFCSTENALTAFIKPEFKDAFSLDILRSRVNFFPYGDQSPEEIFYVHEAEKLLWFFDEYSDTVHDGNRETLHSFDRSYNLPGKDNTWVVAAHGSSAAPLVNRLEEINPEGYALYVLNWQLRSSHGMDYFSKIVLGKMSDRASLNYPVNGARSRFIQISTGEIETIGRATRDELDYWLSELSAGSILICSTFPNHCNSKIANYLSGSLQTNVELLTSGISVLGTAQDKQVYWFSDKRSLKKSLASLEFDVVIFVDFGFFIYDVVTTTVLSRAKYGSSFLAFDHLLSLKSSICGCDESNAQALTEFWNQMQIRASIWGRCYIRRIIENTSQSNPIGPGDDTELSANHWLAKLCKGPTAIRSELKRPERRDYDSVTSEAVLVMDDPTLKWMLKLEELSLGATLRLSEFSTDVDNLNVPWWQLPSYDVRMVTEDSYSYHIFNMIPDMDIWIERSEACTSSKSRADAAVWLELVPWHKRIFQYNENHSHSINSTINFDEDQNFQQRRDLYYSEDEQKRRKDSTEPSSWNASDDKEIECLVHHNIFVLPFQPNVLLFRSFLYWNPKKKTLTLQFQDNYDSVNVSSEFHKPGRTTSYV